MANPIEDAVFETDFIKIYRLEYSFRSPVIGEQEKPGIDDGNAFII